MIPQIQNALNGWQVSITLVSVNQTIVDYETSNVETQTEFKGVVQPLSPEQLKIKPTEQRSWEWLMIHTKKNLEVNTNDRIIYNGNRYKIMMKNDYSLNNYYEYHCVRDYE